MEEMNYALANTTMAITELAAFVGVLAPMILWIKKLAAGSRCQLRHDMLQIYYRYVDAEEIPQYQYENFVAMYEAYKALKGNSFIDKIYRDIQRWEVVARSGGKQ